VSRLQAGALPVVPRPADLAEIIARSLGSIGPQAGAVMVCIPPGLPLVMVDPPLMERVIANVTANALRHAPAGSPPLLTAVVRGAWVVLRVTDRGPGVPGPSRDRIFEPFQRLGGQAPASGPGSRCPAQPDRSDARHAGTGGNSRRRPDHGDLGARPRRRPALIGGPLTKILRARPARFG